MTRLPVFFLVIVALLLAAAFGFYVGQAPDSSRALDYELLDHSGNPNDDKDACPHDGNAGRGNDDKGPNGGCRPPKGQYGRIGGR